MNFFKAISKKAINKLKLIAIKFNINIQGEDVDSLICACKKKTILKLLKC